MSRRYKPFTQRELEWGINLEDSPNEIDNKQCLEATNFNSSGNKLVSAKGKVDSGNPTILKIGGMTIDSGDIWTVSEWSLQKNWVDIPEGVGILITTSQEVFKPWVEFHITIEWEEYKIAWANTQEFIYSLKDEVEANWLLTKVQNDLILIYKADWTTVNYTLQTNKAFVLYNFRNKLSSGSPYSFNVDYNWEFEIDWDTYSWVFINTNPAANQGQVDIALMTQIFWVIPNSYSKEMVFLDSSFNIVPTFVSYSGILINWANTVEWSFNKQYTAYRINWYSSNPVSSPINVDWTPIIWIRAYSILFWWGSVNLVWTINFDWNILNVDWTYDNTSFRNLITDFLDLYPTIYTYNFTLNWNRFYFAKKDWTASSTIISILVNWTTNWNATAWNEWASSWVNSLGYNDNALRALYINWINALWGYTVLENSVSWTLGLHISKTDLSELVVLAWTIVTSTKVNRISEDIRGNFYEDWGLSIRELNNLVWLEWRAEITVGNLWTLVVDKDLWGAEYAYEWLSIEIWEESVGKPTLGTIYQGKIVLWGYPDNDNIVFSQTSSITEPLNVLNFWAYNAWGQSVSWGNKSKLTGFYVSENWLYVFKENEIWYTNSENDLPDSFTFNFVFRKITDTWAYSQQTITGVNQDVFFLDWINRKVRRLSYEQNLTTLRDTSISNEIDKLFDTLPEDQRLATASFKYPNYKLYLSDHTGGTIEYSNGETYYLNNKCFVYNVSEKSWFTEDDKAWIIIAEKWYLASSDWKVYIDDKDRKSSWSFLSKQYDMWESVGYKRYTHFDIYWVNSEEIPLYLDIYEDWELLDSYLIDNNYWPEFRRRFDLWTEWRYFQFGLRYEWKSNIEIHDFSVNFKELKWYDMYQG